MSGLREVMERASESYRCRDDDGTAYWLGEAIRLAPWRTDLRFCLAGRHVQHGEPWRAVGVYEDVLRMAPDDADALFFISHWWRYLGELGESGRSLERLRGFNPVRAGVLESIWGEMDGWFGEGVTDVVERVGGDVGRVAVLILGLQLEEDGGMRPGLVARLEKGLEVLGCYPGAVVVVSGGVPRGGVVEAGVMRCWLEGRGVGGGGIFEEGYSRDIVENLVFSRQVMSGMGVGLVVGVTCAVNVRRTGVGLGILGREYGMGWGVRVVAASGATYEDFRDDGGDALKVYRDALRVYGIPMMSSYPYLAER